VPDDLPPFEFAVVSDGTATAGDWRQLVTRAENLGYDTMFLTDHLDQPLAPLPALAAAAAMSTRLGLGTFVLNADLRNRALLRHEVRTLSVLAEGRLTLGLGAGWLAEDYAAAGLSRPVGGSRLDRLRAALDELGSEAAGADGSGAAPVPRLLIGGGRRRLLAFAAARADVVSVVPALGPDGPEGYADMTPGRVDRKVGWIREAARSRRQAPVINHVIWECFILPRPEPVAAALARALGCGAGDLAALTGFLVGTAEQAAEILTARRERWGFSLITVPASATEQFSAVIPMLRPRCLA
jgi:probable F420-dependent oxidoreductase